MKQNVVLVVLAWLATGCQSPARKPTAVPADTATSRDDESSRRARLLAELQDDILTSYERDEPPELDTSMIDARIGTARIGAGPGDVYIAGDLVRAPSRWPLDVDHSTRTEPRSKRLAIQIAADQSAAWMTDELSWRIEMCGRTAVIPLRITALYAHDGDRWVPVFEHLSYGAPIAAMVTPPKAISTEVASSGLEAALAGVVERGLLRSPRDATAIAQDEGALVLGPDIGDEWHGEQVLAARLPPGKLEDRRVGTVGRGPREPTVAYWVGNYLADVSAATGTVATQRMRVTFVFEKRPSTGDAKPDAKPDANTCARGRDAAECRWMLVQAHMSQPVSDDDLTRDVFGTALLSPKPLELDCTDGTRRGFTSPAAAARPGQSPAEAQAR